MNLIIENYPIQPINYLLYQLKNKILYSNLENKNNLYKSIINNEELNNIIKEDIYYKNTVLEKMELIKNMKIDSDEYIKIYNSIINVGEYKLNN